MDFTTLPMHSILLAPESMHTQIRQAIIEQKEGVIGLRIQSLTQFLSTWIHEEIPSKQMALFTMLHELKKKNIPLHTYQNIAYTESFLMECYRFLSDMQYWGIPLKDLPQHTLAQKELATILSSFQMILTQGKAKHDALSLLKEHTFSNVYIVDAAYPYDEQRVIDILLHRDAHLIKDVPTQKEKHFFHAVNKRQEIEACAQYIIAQQQKAQDIHVTLCDASYALLLQQIFHRYKIPHTMLKKQCSSLLAQQFTALFQLVLHPDSAHVLTCMDTGLFNGEDNDHALREYLRIFEHDIFEPFGHVQNIENTTTFIDERELERLKKLEEQAMQEQQKLFSILTPLLQEQVIANTIPIVTAIMKTSPAATKEASTYRRILHMLEELYPCIQTKDDLAFMLSFIEDIQSDVHEKEFTGVFVHTLSQPVLNRPHHYLLGATQANYPAFQVKKGIFDEAYYAMIPAYPSMEERYAYHQMKLLQLLDQSEYLYISYPLGTYEGKGLESALEIEQYMKHASLPYPLHMNEALPCVEETITPQTAEKLFLRDGKLLGSISSLERYRKCPYSYFLRYGLALQEPMKLGFPDSYAGTLSHYVLETLTTTYGKEYANTSQETIAAILDKELQQLQKLFPAMKDALANVKERLLTAMIQTIKTLKDFEEHSTLAPSKSEYPFTYEIALDKERVLALRGYIDRVDENRDFACILDYKSSSKTLSETNVFAALQLQLLTYALVIAKESGKDILGAYYVSLKSENIACTAGKMSRRRPVTHHIHALEDYQQERKKAQRFNGWTMHKEIALLDDDATHIRSLRMNKEGQIKASKLYDLNTLSTYMEDMYKQLASQILQGNIALRPLEDACTYCVYHEICRFKGYFEEKSQLIEAGDEIYQKGEDEDA